MRPFLRLLPILLALVLVTTLVVDARGALFRRVAADDLPRTGKSFGATWADMDRDGRLDLLLLRHGHGVGVYLAGDGLHFDRRDSSEFVPTHRFDQHGTAACDFDADGDWDLYSTCGAHKGHGDGPNELWSPDDGGRYGNILPPDSPLTDTRGRGRGALWFRLDDDRYPELLVLNFRTRSRLYSWDGDDWTDRSQEVQPPGAVDSVAKWFAKGVAGDLDGDGRTDLLLSGNTRILYRNRPGGELVDTTTRAGLAGKDGDLVQVVAGDVDNDGDLDLLLVYRRPGRVQLWLNRSRPGNPKFAPGPRLNHLDLKFEVVSAALADLDNDGILDLYVLQEGRNARNVPNLLARGQGDGTFKDKSDMWGGRGQVEALPCAVWPVDPDGDGDLDLLLVHGKDDFPDRDGIVVLYENTARRAGLTLRLETGDGPPHGLGARVRLHTAAGVQTRQVRSVGSYFSTTVPPLHFGLGDDPGPYRVVVTWPDRTVQEVELPRGGRAYSLAKGATEALLLDAD
ncbi:MAG: CRTAC1 family protein [bacterium]|nr:CRTAC1 family protein [bacterium]